jgi:hypothetical protein
VLVSSKNTTSAIDAALVFAFAADAEAEQLLNQAAELEARADRGADRGARQPA